MILAALTMTLGNLVALAQDNVKRMLAYSSIAHTGYMLVGFAAFGAGQQDGLSGLLFYGAAYAFMNLGAFAVIAAIQKRDGRDQQPVDVRRPDPPGAHARLLMTLFLLSLTGIPPTAGFFGKFYVILAAVEAGGWLNVLAVLAVLNAAIAAFYYLRVVVYMFMREPTTEQPGLQHGRLVWTGLAVATVMTIVTRPVPHDAARDRRPGRGRGRAGRRLTHATTPGANSDGSPVATGLVTYGPATRLQASRWARPATTSPASAGTDGSRRCGGAVVHPDAEGSPRPGRDPMDAGVDADGAAEDVGAADAGAGADGEATAAGGGGVVIGSRPGASSTIPPMTPAPTATPMTRPAATANLPPIGGERTSTTRSEARAATLDYHSAAMSGLPSSALSGSARASCPPS